MMALVKQTDIFYLFDSHARDSCGMPDPNGTVVPWQNNPGKQPKTMHGVVKKQQMRS